MLSGDLIILVTVRCWKRYKEELQNVFQNFFNLEYEDRTSAINLPSLSYRRHRADMLMVYNILHGNVSLQSEIFFHQQLSSIRRGHSLKLFKPHAQRSVRSNFFSIRSINDWNSLPNEVVSTNSVNSFKILFDNYYI